MSGQPIAHTVAGGFCTVCGDTAEWLEDNLRSGDSITEEAT